MNGLPVADQLVLDPIVPLPTLIVLAVGVLALTLWAYWRVCHRLGWFRQTVLMLSRVLGLVLMLALLLRPSRVEQLPPLVRQRLTLVGLDTSASMQQPDVDGATRLDAARRLLREAEVVGADGRPMSDDLRLFQFGPDARPVSGSVLDLRADGQTTRLHRSVSDMLNTLHAGEAAQALVLLSDGHDFELVNPAKTGSAARARQAPIYAVALGGRGHVRDVSARLTGYQPYCYVRQRTRLTAAVRLIGCEYETLQVQLLRQGVVVQTRTIQAERDPEKQVTFEVLEKEPGQYEYEIRVLPLAEEADAENNSAITYLNVIEDRMRVLLIEGDPYWDTTFLQRSLMRNDKFEVDALWRYGPDRVRALRNRPDRGELHAPATLEDFQQYEVVILGRAVDTLLEPEAIAALETYVKDHHGVVIFSRGPAFSEAGSRIPLEPVHWLPPEPHPVRLEPIAEGRMLAAFRALAPEQGGWEAMPELLACSRPESLKPLAAPLAQAVGVELPEPVPAIVYRRYGGGQVLSVGVTGLWRWSLNPKVRDVNTPFDRFWDQMILWLLAQGDVVPLKDYRLRTSSANVRLGEKVRFRLLMRESQPSRPPVPLIVYRGEREIKRLQLAPNPDDSSRWEAEFVPQAIGRYRAVAQLPNGKTDTSRFMVFNENLEVTEVTTDAGLLSRICESSGGRLLEPEELPKLMRELRASPADTSPRARLKPVWNQAWVFYLTGLWFGIDWFLRRRWGLC